MVEMFLNVKFAIEITTLETCFQVLFIESYFMFWILDLEVDLQFASGNNANNWDCFKAL